MSLVPVYRSRPSALHAARAGVGLAFCCSLALVGALYRHPLVLGAALGGTVLAGRGGRASGARSAARSCSRCRWRCSWRSSTRSCTPAATRCWCAAASCSAAAIDVTLEATVAGALGGLRVVVCVVALGLLSAAVDPDELLRLFRRVSFRSALTASLATRLVPVLARDATRMGDAARCRPHPPARLTVARAALARRARPRRRRGRRARGARLRARRPAAAQAAPVVAARPAGGRRGARDRGGGARGQARGPRAGRDLSDDRDRARPSGARAELCAADLRGAAVRRSRGPDRGGTCLSRWPAPSASATAIRTAPGLALCDVSLDARAGHLHAAGGGVRLGQVDAAAGALRPRAALPRGRGERGARGRRPRRARARAGRAGGGLRHRPPGARDAGGDGRRARRARAAARAPPRVGRRDGARGGGDGALARRRAPARAPHRHALGRRAPARGDRRRDGPRAAPAAARRAHLAARPGGGRRARLAAPPPERGLGHRGRGGRAPDRALPAGRRPRDRDDRRPGGVRRAAGRLPRVGGRARAGARDAGRTDVLARGARAAARVRQAGARRAAGRRAGSPAGARAAPAVAGRGRRRPPAPIARPQGDHPAGARLQGRLARARGRPRRTARHIAHARAGRAGGADGSQRRGQEHAAAPRQRASRSPPGGAWSGAARWRCSSRTRATT